MALRETAMTAPFTQGSRGCSRTSAFFGGSRNVWGDCHTSVRTGSQWHALCGSALRNRYWAGTQWSIDNRPAGARIVSGDSPHFTFHEKSGRI